MSGEGETKTNDTKLNDTKLCLNNNTTSSCESTNQESKQANQESKQVNQESKQVNQESKHSFDERSTKGETKESCAGPCGLESTKLCGPTVGMTYREVEAEVEAFFRAQVLGKKMTQDEYDRNFSNFHAKKDSDAKLKIDTLCSSRNVRHSFSSYVEPKQIVQRYFQNRLALGEIDHDVYAKNFRGCVARKGSEAHRLVACMVEENKKDKKDTKDKKANPQKRKASHQHEASKTLVVLT